MVLNHLHWVFLLTPKLTWPSWGILIVFDSLNIGYRKDCEKELDDRATIEFLMVVCCLKDALDNSSFITGTVTRACGLAVNKQWVPQGSLRDASFLFYYHMASICINFCQKDEFLMLVFWILICFDIKFGYFHILPGKMYQGEKLLHTHPLRYLLVDQQLGETQ